MINKRLTIVACSFALLFCGARMDADANSESRTLWYNKPAQNWMADALPLGNGRLGCMVFGGVNRERIQFNEESLWAANEDNRGSYQAFGEIYVEMPHKIAEATEYRRQLDIGAAVHTTTYRVGETTYSREYFASYPANVIVFHFGADKEGAYSGSISLTDAHEKKIKVEGNKLVSTGSVGSPDNIRLQYEAQVLVLNEGGSLTRNDDRIIFDNCDSVTIMLAAGTDYINRSDKDWRGEHPHERVTANLAAASKKSVDVLRKEHIEDYEGLFNRFSLELGATPGNIAEQPTDARLEAYRKAPNPGLEELIFNYARYLMISSSRPGALPANLQGLWNQTNTPKWGSDYHTDVNLQMNYWFVDMVNLPETFEPYSEYINSIRDVRRQKTREALNVRGWTTQANGNIFGGSKWKWVKGTSAWLAQNMWDHYAFTLDETYLRTRAYPIMKELCEFWVDTLKELPDGTLVAPNGYSPEHGPREDGVSFDQQLVWDLFTNYAEASSALGLDKEFREKILAMKSKLLGPQIGKWGQLQEWMVDRDNPENKHRHLSHLIAVHPGRQISPLITPKLAEAAKVSLNARGDGGTGWSKAWKISMWARLHDGNRAYKLLNEQVQKKFYSNLLSFHPPFQIDGNFGYASGVCEMLLQSHIGKIHLLPALPDAWPTGHVHGIRARGNAEIDLEWKDGRATSAVLKAPDGGTFDLVAPEGQSIVGETTVSLAPGESHSIEFK